jgi:hypothetical protein
VSHELGDTQSLWSRLVDEVVNRFSAPVLVQLGAIQQQLGTLMSEDAAIEAEVAVLVADAVKLKDAFATLQAEVANGAAPSAQTMADLKAAVDGVTATVPPTP